MSITAWSTTASQNGNRLVSGNYLEQQSPSTLNDAGRSVMAQIRSWANNIEWFEYGTGSNTVAYTRVSATQITMPVNVVDQFHVNRRVKIVDGQGATLYGRITSSSFNSPNTALTFEFDSGSLGSGNPTSVSYGIVSATNTSLPSVVPTGTILMTGGASADSGYLICDGTAYSRTTYSALFTKIGTTFGVGNGSSTFNVPNLQAKFPLGKSGSHGLGTTGGAFAQTPAGTNSAPTFTGSSSSVSGSVALSGNTGSHSLTESQLPSHSHYLFANHSMNGNTSTDWARINNSATGNGYDKSASIEYYQASGSDDFKYRIAFDTANATPSLHPSSSVGSGSGHTHSLSGTLNLSGGTVTPNGSVSAPNFTGNVMDMTNPYVALNYQIKY